VAACSKKKTKKNKLGWQISLQVVVVVVLRCSWLSCFWYLEMGFKHIQKHTSCWVWKYWSSKKSIWCC